MLGRWCIDRGHSKHLTGDIVNTLNLAYLFVWRVDMPWKEDTIMSLKETFSQRALAKEKPFSHLCLEYNITRKTGYLWLNRYIKDGLAGLEPHSKRPLTNPNQTSEEVEKIIVNLRLERPTWGPKKLLENLKEKVTIKLPSITTVNEILHRHNLITIEESLKRKKLIRFEKEFPNDLWQMDFKGHFQLLTKQTCYPLTILDDHSRFSISIKACANEQYLSVKKQLTYVFKKYGLPKQINVDNGNPWGNSKLLRFTALTVWLMQLGIWVTHSRPRHPQTNGKIERFHRTLKADLISRYPMRSFSHAQKLFDDWRFDYNYERPHEGIDMDIPSKRYEKSRIPMPTQMPKIEYGENATLRRVRGNGYISFQNKEYLAGEAFKGALLELKHDEANKNLELYFGKFKLYNYDH